LWICIVNTVTDGLSRVATACLLGLLISGTHVYLDDEIESSSLLNNQNSDKKISYRAMSLIHGTVSPYLDFFEVLLAFLLSPG
jgi:hypothetical protein